MANIMAIYDSDILYATRLMEYIQNCKQYDFYVYLFTDKEKLNNFLEHNVVNVLLMNVIENTDDLSINNIRKVYYISDQLHECDNKNNVIFRYQSAKEIIENIYQDLNLHSNHKLKMIHNNKNIIALITPSIGYQKSIFLWSYIKNLSDYSKLLYIPFDLYPVSVVKQIDENHFNLSEFLLYLKENNSNLLPKLKVLIKEYDKFSCLQGITHGLDLNALNVEEIRLLIDKLKLVEDFDTIVFSISFLTDETRELIKNSTLIYPILYEGYYEKGLWNEWKRQILLSDKDLSLNELEIISIPQNTAKEVQYKNLQELTTSSVWPLAKCFVETGRRRLVNEG